MPATIHNRVRPSLWRRALAAAVVLAATGSVLAASPQPAQAASRRSR